VLVVAVVLVAAELETKLGPPVEALEVAAAEVELEGVM